MTNRYLRLLLAAVLVTVPLLAGADEVTDQIDLGARDYQSGQLHEAIDQLQGAIGLIQHQLDARYAKLLPKPGEGWTADPPQTHSTGTATAGAGTRISRRYHEQSGKGSVEIQLAVDPPSLSKISAMLADPAAMSAQPDIKPYVLGGERGLSKHAAQSGDWEIELVLADRILVRVQGRNLSSGEPVQSYIEALDLDAIQRAFGL